MNPIVVTLNKSIKHNCKTWFEDGQGCSVCSLLLYKSPIKSMKEIEHIQEHINARIVHLTMENEKLKYKLRRKK